MDLQHQLIVRRRTDNYLSNDYELVENNTKTKNSILSENS